MDQIKVAVLIVCVIAVVSLLIGMYIGFNLASQETIINTNTDLPPLLGPQGHLYIRDAAFIKQLNPSATRMTIILSLTIEDIGGSKIIIEKIEVPDANFSKNLNIVLEPGDTYKGEWVVLENIPYTVLWETGQTHEVKIVFKVANTPLIYTISGKTQ